MTINRSRTNTTLIKMALAMLMIIQTQPLIKNQWSSIISPVTMRTTYFASVKQGEVINIDITAEENSNYYVAFYKFQQFYPQFTPWKYFFGNGLSSFQSGPVDKAGLWRVQVIPRFNDETFIIKVQISVDQKMIGKYVDAARIKKIIALYYEANQDCSFTVKDIEEGFQKEIKVQMYQGTQVLNFENKKLLIANSSENRLEYTVKCIAEAAGYHYLYVQSSPAIALEIPYITLEYQTNEFMCPYEQQYKDFNEVYKGCSQSCLTFKAISKCETCKEKYVLQDGECFVNQTCRTGQYFDKGKCKKGLLNCRTFQYVGGKCTRCLDNYRLSTNSLGPICQLLTAPPRNSQMIPTPQRNNLQTQPIPSTIPTKAPDNIQCEPGKFLFRGNCQNTPPFCLQIDPINRICTLCIDNYIFNPQTLRCEQPLINCQALQTNIGNRCIKYPQNCNRTNALGRCLRCNYKYTVLQNNSCKEIICEQDEVIINEVCVIPVENCLSYNLTSKRCQQCNNNYTFTPAGICIKQVRNQAFNASMPSASTLQTKSVHILRPQDISCLIWQDKIGIICVNKDPNCIRFEEEEGKCLECKNREYFINRNTGICNQLSDQCRDRHFYSRTDRNCIEVNFFCDKYDKKNGACLTCKFQLVLISGTCLSFTPCPAGEYRNVGGVCLKGDPDCVGLQQLSGLCKSCKLDYEFNKGICCLGQNYLIKPTCKTFILQNCKTLVNGGQTCRQCKPGYFLPEKLGKCKLL